MTFVEFDCITMEKVSSGKSTTSLVDLLLFLPIVSLLRRLWTLFWSSFQSHLSFCNSELWAEEKNPVFEESHPQTCSCEKKDEDTLTRVDAEIIMKRLELFCSTEGEGIQEWLNSGEPSALFDEKEPSLGEVKEAFDVFDGNRDGFIDAGELQRVLCILGLKEGEELQNCKKMINTANENRDERIDFNDFVKLMENSLC